MRWRRNCRSVRLIPVRFGGDAFFDGIQVGGRLALDGVQFSHRCSLEAAQIKGNALCRAVWGGDTPIRFGGDANFRDTVIEGTADFNGAEFQGQAIFNRAWIRGSAFFMSRAEEPKPNLRQLDERTVVASHVALGERTLSCDGDLELLFTENESNATRLWGQPNSSPYVKDAFHNYVVSGQRETVNPSKTGTKAAAYYRLSVPALGCKIVRLRLSEKPAGKPFENFDRIFSTRVAEANEFYERITPKSLSEDECCVHRQALAGMLWSKQYYYFDLDKWLEEHNAHPLLSKGGRQSRNAEWFHMLNSDIISMPDKWEYPGMRPGT